MFLYLLYQQATPIDGFRATFKDDRETLFKGALQGCQACKSDWDLGTYRLVHSKLMLIDDFGWEWHLILRTGRSWLGRYSLTLIPPCRCNKDGVAASPQKGLSFVVSTQVCKMVDDESLYAQPAQIKLLWWGEVTWSHL